MSPRKRKQRAPLSGGVIHHIMARTFPKRNDYGDGDFDTYTRASDCHLDAHTDTSDCHFNAYSRTYSDFNADSVTYVDSQQHAQPNIDTHPGADYQLLLLTYGIRFQSMHAKPSLLEPRQGSNSYWDLSAREFSIVSARRHMALVPSVING